MLAACHPRANPKRAITASPVKSDVGMILIAGLVIVLLGVFIGLLHSPGRIVPLVLDAFIDRKRGNAHAGQAEMIGAIIVSRLGMRIGTNRQAKFLGQRLHRGIKSGALAA